MNSGGGRTFAHFFVRALAFVLVSDSQAPLYGQSREGSVKLRAVISHRGSLQKIRGHRRKSGKGKQAPNQGKIRTRKSPNTQMLAYRASNVNQNLYHSLSSKQVFIQLRRTTFFFLSLLQKVSCKFVIFSMCCLSFLLFLLLSLFFFYPSASIVMP